MKINIEFGELNVLEKYFFNKVNYDKFLEAMNTVYMDESYIEPLWEDFRPNPVRFLTSRSEEEIFQWFLNDIEKMNYKG